METIYKGHTITVIKAQMDWWRYTVTKDGKYVTSGMMREKSEQKVSRHLRWEIDHQTEKDK